MSPALAEITALSQQLQQLAQQQQWPEMLALAQQRQHCLEQYFGQPLQDEVEQVRLALLEIQQTDQTLMQQARQHRQHLLQETVDLRQRWQISDTYQRVQNLPS